MSPRFFRPAHSQAECCPAGRSISPMTLPIWTGVTQLAGLPTCGEKLDALTSWKNWWKNTAKCWNMMFLYVFIPHSWCLRSLFPGNLLKTAARGQKLESYTSWGYNGPRSFPLDLQFRHDQAGSLSFSEDVKHWPSWAKIHRFQGPHPYRHVKPRHVCLQAMSREDGTQPTNILQLDPIGIFLSGCCFSLADAVLDWPQFTLWCAWEGSWVPGSYNENQ